MEYARLGPTGVKVSRICVGCMSFGGPGVSGFEWTLGYEEAKDIIDRAIDLGINFFDTADAYSHGASEEILGRALQGRRDDIVLATKVFNATGQGPNDKGLSRKHVVRGLSESLARLKTDYVDLYQIHRYDYETPDQELLMTMHDLVHERGSVRYIGASSMWAWQFAKLLDTSDRLGVDRFVSMQNQYNLCYREEEREMIPLCRRESIAIIPWSPLARGFLSGKYHRGESLEGPRYDKDPLLKARYFTEPDFKVVEEVTTIAEQRGVTCSQIALAWLLDKPFVTAPIVGLRSIQQLEELVGAIGIHLTKEENQRLEAPYVPRAVQGFV